MEWHAGVGRVDVENGAVGMPAVAAGKGIARQDDSSQATTVRAKTVATAKEVKVVQTEGLAVGS